jgi:hypothetical protein
MNILIWGVVTFGISCLLFVLGFAMGFAQGRLDALEDMYE